MNIRIALAGNPNCGKTTMFNDLTGSSQYVGNWPGVTVEKKEGRLRGNKDVTIVDLPGIYSLSPYSLEEVISRDFLFNEKPDVIIDIVDASNMERNLYLTTQLIEIGIPVVIALNMMDVVEKNGDKIDVNELSKRIGCPVVETSAVRSVGIKELVQKAIETVQQGNIPAPCAFNSNIERAIDDIEETVRGNTGGVNSRWLAIKLFEKDKKVLENVKLDTTSKSKIDDIVSACEENADDESESIITNERYDYIGKLVKKCVRKSTAKKVSLSDKIDKIVTNRWLALPIFFCIMWFIYYISISTVGDMTIGWVEALFGWIQGGAETLLVNLGAAKWALDLVVNGIIGSIGAIFIYVPQLMILFLFLSLLEDSGYMARVAFIMDRIFRRFGLSGKSFIPMLIGTGCSIPGIMASRTIENEKDRNMTIMLTPFIPCGAKLPVFAMFIAMLFSDQAWVGPSVYIISIIAVIVSGIILKGTKRFAGDPAPFVMELPDYKLPTLKGVVIHMWEKAKSFVKKAGTVIFVACAVLWFLQSFNFSLQYLGADGIADSMLASIGGALRWIFVPLGFGGSWAPAVASITGLVAKEVVVATFASVGSAVPITFTQVTAFAFMVFTIFAPPCFAAIGAMHREFGSWKWTIFAISYQFGFAYIAAFLVNTLGSLFLKGTAATTPRVLDISLMEEASETAVINGDIVLIVFGVLIVIGLAVAIINKLSSSNKYAEVSK